MRGEVSSWGITETLVLFRSKAYHWQMKRSLLLIAFLSALFLGCSSSKEERVVFFLHNRFLEEHELHEAHPEYGKVHYEEILAKFRSKGFTVMSEKRKGNVNALDYAQGLVRQIDSLIEQGVSAKQITIIGTSKGGYIAQYVSTIANNPELNFVFIASFMDSDMENIPDINYCGNILCISEKTDPYGVSALARKEASTCRIDHFKEIELNTGMKHGFLFKPLEEWIAPCVSWANGNYE